MRAALRAGGLEPPALCLEIPEAAVMADPRAAVAALERLRAIGVRLALDGFGTGHLSMSCLRELRFDTLKLNRVYVRDLAQPGGDAVLRGIVDMAHALASEVTAKGVATGSQLRALRAIGCDAAQGPLLAGPGRAGAIGRLVVSPPRATAPAEPGADATPAAAERAGGARCQRIGRLPRTRRRARRAPARDRRAGRAAASGGRRSPRGAARGTAAG